MLIIIAKWATQSLNEELYPDLSSSEDDEGSSESSNSSGSSNSEDESDSEYVSVNEENSDDSSAEVLIENEGDIAEMRGLVRDNAISAQGRSNRHI
jgi:hypothetical protein